METKKNKKTFNIIMVAVILIIAVIGIVTVGSVKGWFADEAEAIAKVENVIGVVNIERKGVSFELEKGAALEAGDKISTNQKAEAVLKSGKNTFELAENTVALISEKGGKLELQVDSGEIFGILGSSDMLGKLTAQEVEITAGDGVFSINVQTGSMGINVFEGEVTAVKGEKTVKASAGERISVAGEDFEAFGLTAESLNQFNLDKAIAASADRKLCFSKEELEKVIEERETEAAQFAEEAKGTEQTQKPSGNDNSGKPSDKPYDKPSDTPTKPSEEDKYNNSCTIQIKCSTILNNMGNLTPGKEGYVPSSGVILKTTTVKFADGETVFDVLNRICKEKGIQIEYSWSPVYGSSYVEGINHLYEFDCGQQSGWMYKVNGWFPNYGCSAYKLEDGDSISWLYTCNGLGEDIGGGGVFS